MAWEPRPGETRLTSEDRAFLLDASIENRDQLNAAEFRNNALAYTKYFARCPGKRTAPFTFEWLLRLHHEMFGKVWEWGGRIRDRNLSLGVDFPQVAEELARLLGDLEYWRIHWDDSIERATHLHHRAVRIRQFMNGNGRWSRMLANIMLKQDGSPIVEWPVAVNRPASPARDDYLVAIRQADDGDFEQLLLFHRRHVKSSRRSR